MLETPVRSNPDFYKLDRLESRFDARMNEFDGRLRTVE